MRRNFFLVVIDILNKRKRVICTRYLQDFFLKNTIHYYNRLIYCSSIIYVKRDHGSWPFIDHVVVFFFDCFCLNGSIFTFMVKIVEKHFLKIILKHFHPKIY
ncbi:hypothetical protein ACJX0J_011416, partial [Zea mays]